MSYSVVRNFCLLCFDPTTAVYNRASTDVKKDRQPRPSVQDSKVTLIAKWKLPVPGRYSFLHYMYGPLKTLFITRTAQRSTPVIAISSQNSYIPKMPFHTFFPTTPKVFPMLSRQIIFGSGQNVQCMRESQLFQKVSTCTLNEEDNILTRKHAKMSNYLLLLFLSTAR